MEQDARPEFLTSDVHLGAVPRAKEEAFLRFLEHVGANGRSLFVVGDLFDFWFEYGETIPGKYFRVLASLADLVSAGVTVTLVGGNHDAWGGRFLRDEVGVRYFADVLRTELAGSPALLVHGDGLGKGQPGYRLLKSALRSRPIVFAFRLLHPELGTRIARMVSTTGDKSPDHESVLREADLLETWALRQLQREPDLGLVICGHVHRPMVRELDAGRYYVNTGDWLYHASYIRIEAGQAPELLYWEKE